VWRALGCLAALPPDMRLSAAYMSIQIGPTANPQATRFPCSGRWESRYRFRSPSSRRCLQCNHMIARGRHDYLQTTLPNMHRIAYLTPQPRSAQTKAQVP
jgi:hypothetical protein